MNNEVLLMRLREEIGQNAVLTDSDVMVGYSRGHDAACAIWSAAGGGFPSSTEQVQAVVRLCTESPPIVPRGAGSEHSTGKVKRKWLETEIGAVGMRVHRQLKNPLDPTNLFNPGSMFSLSEI